MGLTYEMVEKKGPFFPQTIQSQTDVDRMISGEAAAAELTYVYDALAETKKQLHGRVPLIGFAGAPWTILAYMVEGSGSKTFSKARRFLHCEPKMAHQLLEKITSTTIAYLRQKVAHGADLVQLFDSWAGILSPSQYQTFAMPYLEQIAASLSTEVPVTIFAKNAWFATADIAKLSCQVVGLDWNHDPATVRAAIGPEKALQGNLDPCQLYAPAEAVSAATKDMLQRFGRKHIANLGHGVYPDTPLEGVKAFIDTVKHFNYENQ
jgi:uroporphyrinogen decarboxylase